MLHNPKIRSTKEAGELLLRMRSRQDGLHRLLNVWGGKQ
ncbi:hypothetical protein GGR89_003619 [Sphingomonas trueperi]|uniref:Uncharacterized protein n=1 Tax=Sphingomonas trueperi TaxID=53317 RepID=A0A7X5Y1D0_9SPHN|nr:hypothetical protein [Sphingomonas trueperi]